MVIKQDNVFEHDTLIVCYETSQIIETPDGIVPYMMFNQALYSDEKIKRTVETFSGLIDRLMNAEENDASSDYYSIG